MEGGREGERKSARAIVCVCVCVCVCVNTVTSASPATHTCGLPASEGAACKWQACTSPSIPLPLDTRTSCCRRQCASAKALAGAGARAAKSNVTSCVLESNETQCSGTVSCSNLRYFST